MTKLTLEEIRKEIALLLIAQFDTVAGLTSIEEIPIVEIALLKNMINLYEDNWPSQPSLTPDQVGKFLEALVRGEFKFFGLNGKMYKVTVEEH